MNSDTAVSSDNICNNNFSLSIRKLLRKTKKTKLIDRKQLEQIRQEGLAQALSAAAAMRQRWPQIRAMDLFGSVLEKRFSSHSDLDLLVEGLRPTALLDAIRLAEGKGPLPVDLKRRKDLIEDLVQGLLRKTQSLNNTINQCRNASRRSAGTARRSEPRMHPPASSRRWPQQAQPTSGQLSRGY